MKKEERKTNKKQEKERKKAKINTRKSNTGLFDRTKSTIQ